MGNNYPSKRAKAQAKIMRFTGNHAKDKDQKYKQYNYHEVKFGNKSAFITEQQFDFLFSLALHRVIGEPMILEVTNSTRMNIYHLREKLDHFGFPKHLIRSGMSGVWTLGVEKKNLKFDKSVLRVTLNDKLFALMEEVLG